jgi:AraC-like DNA-binding protein
MMIYREFRPSPQLRSIVDRLWWLEGSSEEIAADPIPPDGHTEIIVHAAEPFAQRERDETWRVQERFLLAGQATRAVHVEPRGYARMVGARLKPVGAHALFGLSQGELVDHIADLRDIDHGLACRLRDDVSGHEDGEAMIESLDRALQAVMPGITAPCVARRAVGIAIRHRGLVRVADVARQVGVSTRQLERLFNERVGVPPKLFLRILRFQHVLRTLRSGEPATLWVDVALANGFYDQSHFNHDFQAFVGASPAAFHVTNESLAAMFSAIRRTSDEGAADVAFLQDASSSIA